MLNNLYILLSVLFGFVAQLQLIFVFCFLFVFFKKYPVGVLFSPFCFVLGFFL